MKERLDTLLVKRGMFDSRHAAAASIMAGVISVEGRIEDKAGKKLDEHVEISIIQDICPYVGRGGLKLEGAIKHFGIDLHNKVSVDIGASTGGFTDFMLKNGAKKVYAVDVGYGQLDWKLRNDPRVVNLERTNVRYLDTSLIADSIDFISIDVSFISLKLVFPVAAEILSDKGRIVALIKPQFEAGREQVGKGGIVRDHEIHEEVIKKVISYAEKNGLNALDVMTSPIKGAKGNTEYFVLLEKTKETFGNG